MSAPHAQAGVDAAPAVAGPFARLALGVAGGVCGLSAAFGLVVGVAPGLFGIEGPLWMFAGFELVVLTSAAFAVLLAFGRPRDGQALTAGCLAVAVAVSAVLQLTITNRELGGVSLVPFALGRLVIAAVFAAAACLAVIRTRRALTRLVLGLLIASPIVALGAPIAAKRIGINLPDLGAALGGVFGSLGPAASLLGIISIALSGHLLITAFDLPAQDPDEKASPADSE